MRKEDLVWYRYHSFRTREPLMWQLETDSRLLSLR